MKEYVLWGGGLLVALVVLHGLWQAWRSSRSGRAESARPAPQDEALQAQEAQQMDSVDPPTLHDHVGGGVDVGDGDGDGDGDDNDNDNDKGMADEPTGSGDDGPGESFFAEPEGGDEGKRGRRVVIAGKRTEPTVPRNDHLFKVQPTNPAESDRGPPAPAGLDQFVVIWVVAKAGTSFGGQDLIKALADNGLKYRNDATFQKLDVDSGEELFSVVNGLEPGTFDLSDLDALSTPRFVMLLSLANSSTGPAAFTQMLDAAQDISISLGGELRDERMGPITGQTIEYYRARISDYKRKSLRK